MVQAQKEKETLSVFIGSSQAPSEDWVPLEEFQRQGLELEDLKKKAGLIETVTKITAGHARCLLWKKSGDLWQVENLLWDQYHKLSRVVDQTGGGVIYPAVQTYEVEWDDTTFLDSNEKPEPSTPSENGNSNSPPSMAAATPNDSVPVDTTLAVPFFARSS